MCSTMYAIHAETRQQDSARCSLVLADDSSNNGDVVQKCSSLSVAYLDVYSHQRAIAQIAHKHHKL